MGNLVSAEDADLFVPPPQFKAGKLARRIFVNNIATYVDAVTNDEGFYELSAQNPLFFYGESKFYSSFSYHAKLSRRNYVMIDVTNSAPVGREFALMPITYQDLVGQFDVKEGEELELIVDITHGGKKSSVGGVIKIV